MTNLSRELECSVDYLVNEAIRAYLRQRASRPAPRPAVAPPSPPELPPPPEPLPPPHALGTLAIEFQGKRTFIEKTPFLVGRGKQVCDLIILDPNVSRKHCQIEHRNGQSYIVDLGSTGGLYFQERRVANKLLRDGDVVDICGNMLRVVVSSSPPPSPG